MSSAFSASTVCLFRARLFRPFNRSSGIPNAPRVRAWQKASDLYMRGTRAEGTMSPELQKVNALGVYLHHRRIGIISRLAGDTQIFAFEQNYIDDLNRPTLSLSYKSRTGGLVTAIRPVRRRLPSFF